MRESFGMPGWWDKIEGKDVPQICGGCQALLEPEIRVCPHCGVRQPPLWLRRMRRHWGRMVPARGGVTRLLIGCYLLVATAGVLLFGPQVLLNPTPEALHDLGALFPAGFLRGEWWQAITYGFLHGGPIHLAFNLIALSQLGPALEDRVGRARFFVVYMLSLIGAALLDVAFRANEPTVIVGASGAIFGLIGFGLSHAHFSGGDREEEVRNIFLRWLIYGMLFGVMVGADNIAHAGGAATGVLLGFLIERERRRRDSFDLVHSVLSVLLVLLTLSAFAAFIWFRLHLPAEAV